MYRIILTFIFIQANVVFASSLFDGTWQGVISTPGTPLKIEVRFRNLEKSVSGVISIPAQGLTNFALSDISIENGSIHFSMEGVPGIPRFDGKFENDGEKIAGTFTQGGAQLTFHLLAGLSRAEAARKAMLGFDSYLEEVVEQFNVPGLGIAIVAGGEVVYAKGVGYRDIDNKLPMTPDTLFAIGSTTKAMTSTLLGMLADDGKFSWDEPLVRYLPDFRLEDPMITARITPRDIVTHRSGLPRHDSIWYNNNSITRAEMIDRFEHLELTADLRERFQYNNLMYMTAGYLAGHLYGGTWESAMQERLFTPLDMARSNFSVASSTGDENHALPYRERNEKLEAIPFRSIDLIGPAGSVNSSVLEMSKWLLFNLNDGTVNNQQLISPATLKDIHSPHMTMPAAPPVESMVTQRAYGMGWMVDAYRGKARLQHGGGIDGFITSVSLYPDDQLGLVVFNNRSSNLPALVSQMAADRILGLDKVDWTGDALVRLKLAAAIAEQAEEAKTKNKIVKTKPSHDLTDYLGHYRNDGYGDVMITAGKGKKALQIEYNEIQAPLMHTHYDQWHGAQTTGDPSFTDIQLLFGTDFNGNIADLSIPLEILAAPILFTKQPHPSMFDAASLEKFVGVYLGATGRKLTVELTGNSLSLNVPAQPTYKMVPNVSGRFRLQELQGFSIAFVVKDGIATTLVAHQPNGIFESKRQE